jgi:hypothetical protein
MLNHEGHLHDVEVVYEGGVAVGVSAEGVTARAKMVIGDPSYFPDKVQKTGQARILYGARATFAVCSDEKRFGRSTGGAGDRDHGSPYCRVERLRVVPGIACATRIPRPMSMHAHTRARTHTMPPPPLPPALSLLSPLSPSSPSFVDAIWAYGLIFAKRRVWHSRRAGSDHFPARGYQAQERHIHVLHIRWPQSTSRCFPGHHRELSLTASCC